METIAKINIIPYNPKLRLIFQNMCSMDLSSNVECKCIMSYAGEIHEDFGPGLMLGTE